MIARSPWQLNKLVLLQLDPRPIAFFVLLPVAISVMAATSSGYTQALGYDGALIYISLMSLVPWWIAEATTRLAWRVLQPYKPPLWLLACVGIMVASVFIGPYVSIASSLFQKYWSAAGGSPLIDRAANFGATEAVVQTVRGTVFWVAANYLFDRLLNYPRFRYGDDHNNPSDLQFSVQKMSETEGAGLRAKLQKIQYLSDVLHVAAEEHYVRVRSDSAEELVNYKFKDAVRDLSKQDGFQVHRSHWVRRSAISSIKDEQKQVSLKMLDGYPVPVSKPHHALVRQIFQ